MKNSTKPLDFALTTIMNPATGKTPQTSPPEPYLVVLTGTDQGKRFKLHRQTNIFGRGDNADIVISDPQISRRHGAFIIFPDGIVLEDYQSTNGSYVNEQRIKRQSLNLKSRIRAGSTHMKIDYKNPLEAEFEESLLLAANSDALTGIANRRSFMIRAQQELSFCKRNNTTISLVMCDVDHFKLKNDTYGHPAGDQVLKDLANILANEMRSEDLLARYGGEEFIMLLRVTGAEKAALWCERIRLAVEHHKFEFQDQDIATTISLGICTCQGSQNQTLQQMIQIADDALYRAKQKGRNRVECGSI